MRLRGSVERARVEITGLDQTEPEYITGAWFFDVRDLDRPADAQVVVSGGRSSWADAMHAACSEIKHRTQRTEAELDELMAQYRDEHPGDQPGWFDRWLRRHS